MPSEYVARWTGGRIGSGASVFHFAGTNSPTVAQANALSIRTFFDSIKGIIGTGVTITFDEEVRVMTEAGVLTAVLPVQKPASVVGAGGTDWVNGAGGMIRWNTGAIVSGRRLLGRTFIVPMDVTAFVSGEMTSAAVGTIQGAGNALITALAGNSGPLQVWSRANSVVAEVSNCAVPSRPSMLKTRNDRA